MFVHSITQAQQSGVTEPCDIRNCQQDEECQRDSVLGNRQ